MKKKIAILGFGQEGKAVLKFLCKNGANKNSEIAICDKNTKISDLPHNEKNVSFRLGENYLKNLERFDVVFRSPGIPYNSVEIKKAVKAGIIISSATQLFFEKTEKISCKIIGVTGTKGKGTTATLLYKILKACGRDVYLVGNIGKPAIEILPKLKKNSVVVFELSSFQLQDLKFSPKIAIILDVFPDHLDAHKNFNEYLNAKINIAKFQRRKDKIFYFENNKYSRWIVAKSHAKKIPVFINGIKIFSQKDLKMPGAHNFKNALMAYKVALLLGCNKEKTLKIIKGFKGNEHRLELVRKVVRHGSLHTGEISFYNDSASTNPQTAAAAVKSFAGPKILIAGGKDKNLDYKPLAQALKNSNTKLVVLCGENKNKIREELERMNKELRIIETKNLKKAVEVAYDYAKKFIIHNSRFIILFSPAAASFDMFQNYKERGKKFKEIVKSLQK
ncbi:MAG: UDP-N-acetylmuramoyl-L-alanine--D-glutamate ligase [Patescibacteria group bacterium]